MTFHQLASASDWPCREGNLLQLIRSITQIWVVSRLQYGISAPVPQTSSCGETSGSVAKCRPFYMAVITILTSPPFIMTKFIFRKRKSYCRHRCCARTYLTIGHHPKGRGQSGGSEGRLHSQTPFAS